MNDSMVEKLRLIEFLKVGIEYKFTPNTLKNWLEEQWSINQSIEDEMEWSSKIADNLKSWAAANQI